MRPGDPAIVASLLLTKRAVEKHINAIFAKLDLAHVAGISQRVKATLLFLSEAPGAVEARAAPEPPEG